MKYFLVVITAIITIQMVAPVFAGDLISCEDAREISVAVDDADSNFIIDDISSSFAEILAQTAESAIAYNEYEYVSMTISRYDYMHFPLPNAPPALSV